MIIQKKIRVADIAVARNIAPEPTCCYEWHLSYQATSDITGNTHIHVQVLWNYYTDFYNIPELNSCFQEP